MANVLYFPAGFMLNVSIVMICLLKLPSHT
jgi:hypothetical protein